MAIVELKRDEALDAGKGRLINNSVEVM